MRQRFGRPTPSLAISLIALFVALGGTSYAVATGSIDSRELKNNDVRGKDIKNSTIQGKDVKNGTLKSDDISDATEAALKGQTGAQGLQGPRGPSTVYWAANTNSFLAIATCSDTTLDACPSLLTVQVPAGRYLVEATTGIDNFNAVVPTLSNRCGIMAGFDVFLDEQRLSLAANGLPGETESVALQRVITANSGTTFSLRCTEHAAEELRLEQPRLSALQVASTVP